MPAQGNDFSIFIGSPHGIPGHAAAWLAVLHALINPVAGSAGKKFVVGYLVKTIENVGQSG